MAESVKSRGSFVGKPMQALCVAPAIAESSEYSTAPHDAGAAEGAVISIILALFRLRKPFFLRELGQT